MEIWSNLSTEVHPRTSWVSFSNQKVYESYYSVKNVADNNNFIWISSNEDVSQVSLPSCEVTTIFRGIWELEDTSRVLDPIQLVILKKPPKIIALLKVKDESPTLPKELIIKTIDMEKRKAKFYTSSSIMPNSRIDFISHLHASY